MNSSLPELELEVEGPAANLTPNKQNPGSARSSWRLTILAWAV